MVNYDVIKKFCQSDNHTYSTYRLVSRLIAPRLVEYIVELQGIMRKAGVDFPEYSGPGHDWTEEDIK